MHENREISSPPWSADQGRSAKATSRTADMHVLEKSDCAVLPVNQPNKGGQPSAEAGEGRAQTRENIVQSRMHPTQSGKCMSQGLGGVRKAAKESKQEQFTALLHHLSIGLLRDSFYGLQRKASPGVDGVTWQEYESGLEERLIDLHSRVHCGAYRAQPSRRVFIPKADGRQRPLGVAALEDKIVQQAVVTILNQIYEVDFKGFSYGFRPGRSPHQALDALTVGIQRKRVNWVLDAAKRSREVVGRNNRNGKIAPKSIVIEVADLIPLRGRQEFRMRYGKCSELLPGLIAGMQPKDDMGTREIRQVQACLVGANKLTKREGSEGLTEVRLPDSTLRSGEPATWGSGQRKLIVRGKHELHSKGGFGLLCKEKNRQS